MDFNLIRRGIRNKLNLNTAYDNDFFVDRIFHRYTVRIIVLLFGVTVVKQLYQAPINCWIPAELRRYEKFIDRYCWLKGTYHVDFNYQDDAFTFSPNEQPLIHYYKWTNFFLALQAFLFYFPRLLWQFFTNRLYQVDLNSLIHAAQKYDYYFYDKKTILTYLSAHLGPDNFERAEIIQKLKSLILNRSMKDNIQRTNIYSSHDNISFIRKKLSETRMCMTYLFIKLMYLFVTVFQIYTIDRLLVKEETGFYGDAIWRKFIEGQAELAVSNGNKSIDFFPLITACEVNIKEMGAIGINHNYNFSCILTLNLFNEKVFMFIWLWMSVFLLPLALVYTLKWMRKILYRQSYQKYKFIKVRLRIYLAEEYSKEDSFLLHLFSEFYIRHDDFFVLRLIEENSNLVVVSDLINHMWTNFKLNVQYHGSYYDFLNIQNVK